MKFTAYTFFGVLCLLPTLSFADAGKYTDSTKQAITPYKQYFQCNQSLSYDIAFLGKSIGYYNRDITWLNNYHATIRTRGKADVLFTKSSIDMTSQITWDASKNQFMTLDFRRKIKGLLSGLITAKFTNNGLTADLVIDGKNKQFNSPNRYPILDGDAIGEQMRYVLLAGIQNFEVNFLGKKDVSTYYFRVKGEEMLSTPFGRIPTLRIEQIRKSDRTLILWFAPSLNYQLVRAKYKRKIVELEATLTRQYNSCTP